MALHRHPRWLVGLAVAALLLIGLGVRGPLGALALLVLLTLVAGLLFLSWPQLDRRSRLLRVLALGALVGAFTANLTRW